MTLAGLHWCVVSAYLDETDDGRYRVRKLYDAVTGDWQYRAIQTGPVGREVLLGGFASNAEARACCSFHSFPSETSWPHQEPAR